jgi:hypothetical protein
MLSGAVRCGHQNGLRQQVQLCKQRQETMLMMFIPQNQYGPALMVPLMHDLAPHLAVPRTVRRVACSSSKRAPLALYAASACLSNATFIAATVAVILAICVGAMSRLATGMRRCCRIASCSGILSVCGLSQAVACFLVCI